MKKLREILDRWFYSDLDVELELKHKSNGEKAYCKLESNAYYEHINDPMREVTIKSVRHGGDKRAFNVIECPDGLFEQLKQYCYTEYTKDETLDLVKELTNDFRIRII